MTEVELSILAAPPDVPFLGPTLRHQLKAFESAERIAHRVLVLDERPTFDRESAARVRALGEGLVSEGRLDEVRSVDWSPPVVGNAMRRWFGDDTTITHASGRARYQYIYSVESSTCPMILHLDSDVLFHGNMAAWLESAVDRLCTNEQAVAVVPNGAIPQATRPIEWLFGERFDRPDYASGWNVGTIVSTRALLLDISQVVAEVLPLALNDPGEQWEQSLSTGLQQSGLERHTLVDSSAWMLHPHRHNRAHVRWLDELIQEVEEGRYPYRRKGRPWDITTEGRRFLPWLPLVARRSLLNRVRRPSVA